MTFPTAPCAPWATSDDLSGCSACADIDPAPSPDLVERMLLASSGAMFQLSGRQFAGECTRTVHPCTRRYLRDWSDWLHPVSSCGCRSSVRCFCSSQSEIELGAYPIRRILSVSYVENDELVELDEEDYRLNDYRYLERLEGSWPLCQEPGDFEVEYTYGQEPPEIGKQAVIDTACQLILACAGSNKCKLPKRTQQVSRQGVTVTTIAGETFLKDLMLTVESVGLFLEAYNPHNVRRRATVLSPERWRKVRRLDTGEGPGS